jgi:hypothetical protein
MKRLTATICLTIAVLLGSVGLSDGRRLKFRPSVAGIVYDWLRIGGHLGNVGEYH